MLDLSFEMGEFSMSANDAHTGAAEMPTLTQTLGPGQGITGHTAEAWSSADRSGQNSISNCCNQLLNENTEINQWNQTKINKQV